MIYDFNDSKVSLTTKEYDVCICGAGAAGITLAKTLAENGKKILLLEGGGREFSEQSQNIYKGKNTGLMYYLNLERLRFLGGTTNHWAGRCRPFVKEDFYDRTINGLPGWPIEFEEIHRYLPQTKEILGLPAQHTFKAEPGTHIDSTRFEPDAYINSDPVRFGSKYFQLLSKSENIDLFLNANVTELILGEHLGTVKEVNVKKFDGKQQRAHADKFILSMGALEIPRLLLNSDKQVSHGIGNKTDMVGRCFMDHLNINMGEFIGAPEYWQNTNSMEFFTDPEYRISEGLASANITFSVITEYKTYGRTAELKKIINSLSCRWGISDKLQFLYKYQCLGEGVISTLCEQQPNKNSRVTLNDEVDKLGLRRITLDWQLTEHDKFSIRKMAVDIAKDFASSGLGRVKLASYILNNEPISLNSHAHQMGTTRMAENSKNGVVDKNSRVFGIDNLYIAGSSIFSTGGGGNPTMPIIQLSLRLADHLLNA